MYSAILMALQFFSKHGFVLEGFLTSCTFDYLSRDVYSRFYMMIMISFGYVTPLLFIIIFYILTKLKLNKRTNCLCNNLAGSDHGHSRAHYQSLLAYSTSFNNSDPRVEVKFSRIGRQITTNTLLSRSSANSNSMERDRRNTFNNVICQRRNFNSIINRESRVLKTIILNVTLFCFAWTPYAMVALIGQFSENREHYLNPYTTSLPALFAKISSIYNPVLYTLSNRECRMYFQKFFKKTV
jgi:hypothetical protein